MKTNILTDKKDLEEIIQQCTICYVGLNNDGNAPYVFPMNFSYQDGVIILHSAPTGHHLDLIKKNNRISITFSTGNKLVFQHPEVACSYRMESKSVICTGEVSFIEELNEKEKYLNLIMQKYTGKNFNYSPPALANVKIWKITVKKMTGRAFGQKHVR